MSPQSVIAQYRLTSKIGEGVMGAVYRAADTKLNRGRGQSWRPDGTILFGVVAPLGIRRVSAEGGDPVPTTVLAPITRAFTIGRSSCRTANVSSIG